MGSKAGAGMAGRRAHAPAAAPATPARPPARAQLRSGAGAGRVKGLQEVHRPPQLGRCPPPAPPLLLRHELNHLVSKESGRQAGRKCIGKR